MAAGPDRNSRVPSLRSGPAELAHAARAFPTLLKVGFAGMLAYRTEFLIWILTTNMPLVMMGLWTAVAADGPVGRFGTKQFVAYYLATLMVRLLTSTWMVWELTMEIRQGVLATRLLRPLHPLYTYAAEHLAAIPMRAVVAVPLVAVLVFTAGDQLAVGDPLRAGIFVLSLIGAWLILFFTMAIIGSLALFVDSAITVFDVWLGLHFVLSGYLIPLELMPSWVSRPAAVLPFKYTLALPVETLVGLNGTTQALAQLGVQWLYVVGLFAATMLVWRAGMRRFVAFGG
jgi:ABC-2 type transport system permease protein